LTYFSDEAVDGLEDSGMNDNKNACQKAFYEEIEPLLSEVVGDAKDEGKSKLSKLIKKACELYVKVYTKKLKMLKKFPLLKNLANSVAKWVCGQIGDVVAKVAGKKIDRMVGETIDNTIEDIADEVSETVCSTIKKVKKGGGTSGAYTLGGTSLAAAMVLAFA